MSHNNQEFIRYFEALGYKLSWDTKYGEYWHEIFENGALIAQIDFDVPLEHLIEDFECILNDKPTTSESDYLISGEGQAFDRMIKRVVEGK